jgi:hypothetical protein
VSDDVLVHYDLNRNEITALLYEVSQELTKSGGDAERNLATNLFLFHDAFNDPNGEVALEDTIQILGTAANDPQYLANQQRLLDATPNVDYMTILPDKAYEWGKQFLLQTLREVREIICTNSGEYANLKNEYKSYPKAFAVAVSTALMAKLGASSPMALGIATLVLLSLAQATKNSFCKMTDEQVIKKIDRTVDKRRKEQSAILKEHFGSVLTTGRRKSKKTK